MAKFGNDYVNVYIYSGTLKEMLNDRFDEMWSKDLTMDEVEMYHNAFNDMVDGEAFNGQEFDVIVKVEGGGLSGQAGAVRHGIARALVKASEDNKAALKTAGFLTRDPRMKERKKPGLKKARKAPQFSKR